HPQDFSATQQQVLQAQRLRGEYLRIAQKNHVHPGSVCIAGRIVKRSGHQQPSIYGRQPDLRFHRYITRRPESWADTTPRPKLMTTTYRVGYLIGSLSKDSINRKLAGALIKLSPKELEFHEISFKDLPLYNYDYDDNYPDVGTSFKKAISSS